MVFFVSLAEGKFSFGWDFMKMYVFFVVHPYDYVFVVDIYIYIEDVVSNSGPIPGPKQNV